MKIDRARALLAELQDIETRFFSEARCSIIYDTQTNPGHKLAKVKLDTPTPEIIHVLAGEIIYHLRSSLDQVAVAFARNSSGPTQPKNTYYPTGDNFRSFVKSCKGFDRKKGRLTGNLRHFDTGLRKAVLRTRPYDGGNDQLRAVFRMANVDKHMELIAVAVRGGINVMQNFTIKGAFVGYMVNGPGNLGEGVVFSDLMPEGSITPNHPNAKITVRGKICLGGDGFYAGNELLPFLTSMVEETAKSHDNLRQAIAGGDEQPPSNVYFRFGAL
ncbi:hypothetical protein QLH51_19735 [Sphingomonas sp. 2R-10]|uniref:hypothetical protein n=1 Tax=Sphingomonas sp. 2R-10 TaxID=3045148 RepID=UPI000F78C5F7|nr:hypothetical protein [Sphingomonas sp. 2R-10]MDJ0279017.1 hypothetical protein [Sphingomonas sp. 2R-10]